MTKLSVIYSDQYAGWIVIEHIGTLLGARRSCPKDAKEDAEHMRDKWNSEIEAGLAPKYDFTDA